MTHRVVHDGRVYEAGAEVDLPEPAAKPLVAVGAAVPLTGRKARKPS